MPRMERRLQQALDAFDRMNAEDPNVWEVDGRPVPKELAHARCVTAWVERLVPAPSEALRLAARAAHLRRWTVPRSAYPEGRRGYLKWRGDLKRMHAEAAEKVLEGLGFPAETIARVRQIVLRADLEDPETQALEDALCLTFLEWQFADFGRAHPPEKIVQILRKTWKKMSPKARDLALELAPSLPDDARRLLDEAVA